MNRLDRAKQFLAIAESGDAKREAYKAATEEIAAHVAETGDTYECVATHLDMPHDTLKKYMAWRRSGYKAATPWLADERATDRAAVSHGRKVLREQPETLAPEIAEAMENPAVREQVYSHMDDKAEQEREERREQRRAVREEQHEDPNAALVRLIAADLHRADLTLRRAVDTAREASPWSDKDRQWLEAHVNRTAGWLDMLRLAIEQASDIDWDAALAELTVED